MRRDILLALLFVYSVVVTGLLLHGWGKAVVSSEERDGLTAEAPLEAGEWLRLVNYTKHDVVLTFQPSAWDHLRPKRVR